MQRLAKSLAASAALVVLATTAGAQTPLECGGTVRQSKSVTLTGGPTAIAATYPAMQLLLRTSISNTAETCLVAHLSALSRITDNQVYYQVSVDGVVMQGHVPSAGPAIVYNALDDVTLIDNHEQASDSVKDTSFNFFGRLLPGVHEVRVLVAAGSAIDAGNPPTVQSPVLALVY